MYRLLLSFVVCVIVGHARTVAQENEAEPTLPEIVVEPDTDQTEVPSPQTGESQPAVGQPTPSAATPTVAAFDLPASYPDLSDLRFGQTTDLGANTGILRSQKSLFDAPVAGSITTRQDMVESQATDMFQALQQEVGVLMQSTAAGQASPFLRGVNRSASSDSG